MFVAPGAPGASTATSAEATRRAAAARQSFVTPTRATPTQVVAAARATLREIKGILPERLTGTVVYPDGKAPCPAGPYGDDIGAGKTHELDPNHCLTSGGPWVAPLLERPIDCSNPSEELLWLDLIARVQPHLRALAALPPRITAMAEEKVDYVQTVMELGQILALGCNVSQRFLGVAASDEETRPEWTQIVERGLPQYEQSPPQDDDRYLSMATLPMVGPSFFVSGGSMGWSYWGSDHGIFQSLVKGEIEAFQGGWFAPNSGFTKPLFKIARRDFTGRLMYREPYTRRLPLPGVLLEMLEPGARRDRGAAERALRQALRMAPKARLLAIARSTNSLPPMSTASGWSFDRIYKLLYHGLPEPARTIDTVRACRVYGINFYVQQAYRWATALGRLDVSAVLVDSALAYLQKAKTIVEALDARGLPIALRPSDIQALIGQIQNTQREEAAGMLAVGAGVLSLMGPFGAIAAAVATVVLGGFMEFLRSSVPPSSQADFALILQPYALRSTPKDSPCSFNPESEGGVGRIFTEFLSRSAGGSGRLWDVTRGIAPPDAPDALRTLSQEEMDRLLAGLLGGGVGGSGAAPAWLPWALGAGAIVGGALVVKKLRG